jgi:2-dehydro-3-deoxyphosphogluconate aldolase/(4S)-4-hydroxy-2-oxoglutarate aldolase
LKLENRREIKEKMAAERREEMKDKVMQELHELGIIPVVVLDNAEDAEALSDALVRGGLPCAEVTFRTDAAAETIRRMAKRHPDMLVGAGTVLSPEKVVEAKEAGARFIFSPGLNPDVVKKSQELGLTVIPGTQTPSEMEEAMELGLDVVKFFPAELSGGIKMLKAVSAPYVNLKFMPTGGLNAENVKDYLAWDRILACGGSWIAKNDLVKEGRFDEIEARAREARQIVKEIRG